LKGTGFREADEIVAECLGKRNAPAPGNWMIFWRDEYQLICGSLRVKTCRGEPGSFGTPFLFVRGRSPLRVIAKLLSIFVAFEF